MNIMKRNLSSLLAVVAIGGATFVYSACSDDTNAVVENPDSGVGTSSGGTSGHNSSGGDGDAGDITFDAGLDDAGKPKDCFDNPKTHFEIINGCTNSTPVIRQQTKSKLLLADGGLPTP